MTWDLRLGDWRDVLADVECDALITDPPYSARTHAGAIYGGANNPVLKRQHSVSQNGISYSSLTQTDMAYTLACWLLRTSGWACVFTDHVLAPVVETAMRDAGRTVFAPVPTVQRGMNIRLAGDGPSNWTCWLIVARPKSETFRKWGTLPGAYIGSPRREMDTFVTGAKPLWLMQGVVRDYTRPGDLICDPFAGSGTTLLAAEMLGRDSVGAESDQDTHAKAVKRLTGAREQTELAL